MGMLFYLVAAFALLIGIAVTVFRALKKPKREPPDRFIQETDNEGFTRVFPDVGIALKLGAWTQKPSRPGKALVFMLPDSDAILQLTEHSEQGGTPQMVSKVAETLAVSAAQKLSQARPATALSVAEGLSAFWTEGELPTAHITFWALGCDTGYVLMNHISKHSDTVTRTSALQVAQLAKRFVSPLSRVMEELGAQVVKPAPETAYLRLATDAQRAERAGNALCVRVAPDWNLLFVAKPSPDSKLMTSVTEESLAEAKMVRNEFVSHALNRVVGVEKLLLRQHGLVSNEPPEANASLGLMHAEVTASLTRTLGSSWLIIVPSHAVFWAAEDTPEGHRLLSDRLNQLKGNWINDLSTRVYRFSASGWALANEAG